MLEENVQNLSDAIGDAFTEETILIAEILSEMTENTHKFDCGSITKRITRRLIVERPLTLFHLLPPALQRKVKMSFPNSDILKAVEIDVININGTPGNENQEATEPVANIAKTESLTVKPN